MKKRSNSAGSKKSKLLPTNAPFVFYDPLQQQFREPRKGGFKVELEAGTYQRRVSDGAIKIERAWADVTTAELQAWIDMFAAELLKRALAGEDEAVDTFALKAGGLVSRLQDLTSIQRKKVEQIAARSPHWSVNLTQRDTDFAWAKKYIRELKVGSKSLLPGKPTSRIRRHEHFARLAEKLWLRLLENRHELPDLIERVGSENARKLKTKWISLCLSLPAVKTAREVTGQDAPKWWRLGEALLQEEWEQDRQSAFASVLPEYAGKDQSGKDKYTDAYSKKAIFKQLRSAFLHLLGHDRTSKK
jgi:hypothetical protein